MVRTARASGLIGRSRGSSAGSSVSCRFFSRSSLRISTSFAPAAGRGSSCHSLSKTMDIGHAPWLGRGWRHANAAVYVCQRLSAPAANSSCTKERRCQTVTFGVTRRAENRQPHGHEGDRAPGAQAPDSTATRSSHGRSSTEPSAASRDIGASSAATRSSGSRSVLKLLHRRLQAGDRCELRLQAGDHVERPLQSGDGVQAGRMSADAGHRAAKRRGGVEARADGDEAGHRLLQVGKRPHAAGRGRPRASSARSGSATARSVGSSAATDSIGPRSRSTPCRAGTSEPVAAVDSLTARVFVPMVGRAGVDRLGIAPDGGRERASRAPGDRHRPATPRTCSPSRVLSLVRVCMCTESSVSATPRRTLVHQSVHVIRWRRLPNG